MRSARPAEPPLTRQNKPALGITQRCSYGGILSPLLANIALSVLDEALHAPWQPAGEMSTTWQRRKRRWNTLPNWRLVRYADDFVVLTDGNRHHLDALREQITQVLQPMGLVLSPAKTHIVHMSEGLSFLGFHIQWKRKRGTNKWYVYTFIADRPLRSVKAKIRALTPRTSQVPLKDTLIRINQIIRGWANYFRHAVATRTFRHLQYYTWWRIVHWQRTLHRWRWKDVRRWLTDPTGRWRRITADGIALFDPTSIPIRRYRYRGKAIPNPFTADLQPARRSLVESPVR
jgi:RNA-directed DNA polymerase